MCNIFSCFRQPLTPPGHIYIGTSTITNSAVRTISITQQDTYHKVLDDEWITDARRHEKWSRRRGHIAMLPHRRLREHWTARAEDRELAEEGRHKESHVHAKKRVLERLLLEWNRDTKTAVYPFWGQGILEEMRELVVAADARRGGVLE
ncbi:hypothetical protein C8035_v007103 [Colletotrichum spinosum]|uniref:Uncharacterized protein n=1 Tax=Colletotrichum spinosum TaxID=1347390 RepID=A0A4R8QDA2_9PEZI|nr:hypothetical protein C8035_v007103 [Colletotrichum spinosum]